MTEAKLHRTSVLAAAVGVAVLLALAGCGSKSNSSTTSKTTGGSVVPASASSSPIAGKKVTFIIYSTPSTPFFVPVVNGAKDAARIFGLNLNVEYSNSDVPTQNNQIESAIASGTNALAVAIPDNSAFTKTVCNAHNHDIPVVAFNVDATAGPVLNCAMSFVGQNFTRAGYLIAQTLMSQAKLPHGAHVFCPVEQQTAVYAVQRAAGADQALAAIGAKCDVVGTGFDLGKAQTLMQQYLIGHHDTKAILGLGEVPLQVAPAAAKAAGLSHPAIAGFDLSPQIAADIKNGTTIATIEQQPYLQGYYSVLQLALNLQYGLQPSNIDTGNAIVDKSNIARIAALAGKIY